MNAFGEDRYCMLVANSTLVIRYMWKFQSELIDLIKVGPIWTVSNFFSLLRVVLLPFILIALRSEANYWAVILMIMAALTDALDGLAARYLNQISNLGKMIDPLADKIAFGAIAYFLVVLRDFPLWAVLILIGRDLLIVAGSALMIHHKKHVQPSNRLGKTATLFLIFTIFAYTVWWNEVKYPLLLVTVLLLIVSTLKYAVFYIHEMWLSGSADNSRSRS